MAGFLVWSILPLGSANSPGPHGNELRRLDTPSLPSQRCSGHPPLLVPWLHHSCSAAWPNAGFPRPTAGSAPGPRAHPAPCWLPRTSTAGKPTICAAPRTARAALGSVASYLVPGRVAERAKQRARLLNFTQELWPSVLGRQEPRAGRAAPVFLGLGCEKVRLEKAMVEAG